jgi:cell division protease FtsH
MGWPGERDFSEDTARAIDAEVREMLERLHDRVRGILTTKKAALMAGAAELKQVETLEGERLRRVLTADGADRTVGMGSQEAGR